MKNQLSIIAIVALSSQLTFAETATDLSAQNSSANAAASTTVGLATNRDDMATTTNTLPLLSDEVGSGLQSKLEAQMEFDLGPRPNSEHTIASID